ncbi:MAG: hypothetical protein Q7K43_06795, partial [Candidatus Woesearchaeota archaeon]|nr:hypothetical protein [Candidatus Woesearchaeota archaeon]
MSYSLKEMLNDENVDHVARSLLQRIFPILKKGVEQAGTFFMRSSQGVNYAMNDEEVAYWNQGFNLTAIV